MSYTNVYQKASATGKSLKLTTFVAKIRHFFRKL